MFGQKLEKLKIWESKKQKLLGVEIDRTLSCDEYVFSLCKKAGKKFYQISCVQTRKEF